MSEHVELVSQSCFHHIRTLHHICSVLDLSTATVIAAALISSRLDYANSVLYGSPSKNTARLQRAQNTAAKVVTQKPSDLSSINTLCELH